MIIFLSLLNHFMKHVNYYSLCCTVMFMICFSSVVTAQSVVNGSIVDASSNTAIEGASVTMLPSKKTAFSDALGKFSFKTNKSSDVSFVVTSVGHKAATVTLKAFKDSNNSIRLVAKSISLKDITISTHA